MNEFDTAIKAAMLITASHSTGTCQSRRWESVFRRIYMIVMNVSEVSDKVLKKHYNNLTVVQLINDHYDQLTADQKIEIFEMVIRRANVCM